MGRREGFGQPRRRLICFFIVIIFVEAVLSLREWVGCLKVRVDNLIEAGVGIRGTLSGLRSIDVEGLGGVIGGKVGL